MMIRILAHATRAVTLLLGSVTLLTHAHAVQCSPGTLATWLDDLRSSANRREQVRIGERVRIQFKGEEPKEVQFMGKWVYTPDKKTRVAFYDAESGKIHWILESDLSGGPTKDGMQRVAHPVEQKGATCITYANVNCLRQMQVNGLRPDLTEGMNGNAIEAKAQEIFRYLAPESRKKQLDGMDRYLADKKINYEEILLGEDGFEKKLTEHLKSGNWAILNYNTGLGVTDMSLIEHNRAGQVSKSTPHFVPARKGVPHGVLAVGTVQGKNGESLIVILDSAFGNFYLMPVQAIEETAAGTAEDRQYLLKLRER